MLLMAACVLGFISVGFGAYSEHGLRPMVTEEEFRFLMTAIRYNQIYATVVTALALVGLVKPIAGLATSGWIFTIGTVLFSFSIYAAVFFGSPGLTILTPIGGTTLMIGWLVLGLMAWRVWRNQTRGTGGEVI